MNQSRKECSVRTRIEYNSEFTNRGESSRLRIGPE